MTKRELQSRIFLSGQWGSYTVRTGYFDGHLDIPVHTVRVGNAIVRALRAEAEKRPDLFPNAPPAVLP